jgi:hypothetical protein
MSALSEKMRKAREVRIDADKYVFVALRPTPLERQEKFRVGESSKAIMSFVVGWENVVESDLIPGGDPHPLKFDQDACSEWLSDRPDLFSAVVDGIITAYDEYASKLDAELGN